MSFVCPLYVNCMLLVPLSYVLVYYLYIFVWVTRMSSVCHFLCTRMSPCVTSMWFYHEPRRTFLRSLVYKKNFGLMWQIVFKLNTYFFKEGRITLFLSLNEFYSKWFCKQPKLLLTYSFQKNVYHWLKFKAPSRDTHFAWTFDLLLINSSRYF